MSVNNAPSGQTKGEEQMGQEATNKAKAFDWAGMLKADVKGASVGADKPRWPIPHGKHAARIAAIKLTTFSTGSYGLQITYALEGAGVVGRTINEYIVLTTSSGSKTEYGDNNLKRRLMAVLSADQLANFKQPKNDQDLGDFRLLFNAPVTVDVKDGGVYKDRPTVKVGGVYERKED